MKRMSAAIIISLSLASAAHAGPVEDMLAVDRAFSAMAAAQGVPAAFAAYAADDVRMFPDGGVSYKGKDTLVARFANWPEGATLSWTPLEGEAAPGGDFGYTWGEWVYTSKSEEGETSSYGKYVSIWRKEPGGEWKFIVDVGNSSPAPDAAN